MMAAKDYRAWLRSATRTENPGDENAAPVTQTVVLRAPAGYACGLCLSQYARFADARHCLESCSLHYRLREPVHVLASPAGTHFRCCMCARVRVHRDDALRCFVRCYRAAHDDLELPARLAEALETLRGSGSAEGRAPGGDHGGGGRGPLFHRSQGLLAGKNGHLSFGAGRLGDLSRRGAVDGNEGDGVDGLEVRSDRGAKLPLASGGPHAFPASTRPPQATPGQANRTPTTRPPPPDDRSLADRAEELLSPDLLGADVTDADMAMPSATRGEYDSSRAGSTSAAGAVRSQRASPGIDSFELERGGDEPEDPGPVNAGGRQGLDGGSDFDLPESPPAVATAGQGEPARDKHGKVLYRVPHQKPFKRADAKYACTVCNAKFFSKTEVEACFMAHPLNEMV